MAGAYAQCYYCPCASVCVCDFMYKLWYSPCPVHNRFTWMNNWFSKTFYNRRGRVALKPMEGKGNIRWLILVFLLCIPVISSFLNYGISKCFCNGNHHMKVLHLNSIRLSSKIFLWELLHQLWYKFWRNVTCLVLHKYDSGSWNENRKKKIISKFIISLTTWNRV